MKTKRKQNITGLLCLLCACTTLTVPARGAETAADNMSVDTGKADTAKADTTESASDNTPLLSPAIRILAAKTTLRKNGVVSTGADADTAVTFSQADFEKVLGYTPSEVVIETLPDRAAGVLKLGTLDIAAGTALSASAMNNLRFVPVSSAVSEDAEECVSASFTFTASGKVYQTDTPLSCMVYLLPEENSAPAAADLAVTTYTETGLWGSLRAADPEADEMHYTVVREPKKGTVSLDESTGTFVYTPYAGKRGSDVFTYRVSDEWGNESELCRVEVEIRRAGEAFCYEDLDGHWCASAAMYCAEEGVMTGSNVGGVNLFSPETFVTRGEFLVTAMRAAGYDAAEVEATYDGGVMAVFADAKAIPDYMRPYVETAYDAGIISGSITASGETVFSPEETMTRAEAAVVVQRLFGIESPSDAVAVYSEYAASDLSDVSDAEDSIPAWSADAVSALRAAGILSVSDPMGTLDRAQTAVILAAAMQMEK
ncbi:MAG: S-layer homology domain-containing protein [Clostridia bacterium]|nr:S-layer homology domain-containing protein [Clostridia bacterium]